MKYDICVRETRRQDVSKAVGLEPAGGSQSVTVEW